MARYLPQHWTYSCMLKTEAYWFKSNKKNGTIPCQDLVKMIIECMY